MCDLFRKIIDKRRKEGAAEKDVLQVGDPDVHFDSLSHQIPGTWSCSHAISAAPSLPNKGPPSEQARRREVMPSPL